MADSISNGFSNLVGKATGNDDITQVKCFGLSYKQVRSRAKSQNDGCVTRRVRAAAVRLRCVLLHRLHAVHHRTLEV